MSDSPAMDILPGETAPEYIKRMHQRGIPPYVPPVPNGGCNCPREYSRCRFAVAYDRKTGDHSRGHGGWGW